MTRLAILCAAVTPYHAARFRAAATVVESLTVVATRNDGAFDGCLAHDTGPYRTMRLFKGRADYEGGVTHGAVRAAVTAALERIGPDAIAAAGWHAPESLAAIAWARRRGVPLILMAESQRDDVRRSPLREGAKRRVVSLFDAALVGGPPHADYAAALGIPRPRVHFGYNAVDNDHFSSGAAAARADAQQIRARHGLPSAYVLASSRFVAKKNLVALVRAYAAARRRVPHAPDLVILGDGPDRTAVETAIAAAGIGDTVHLPGFRRYADLPAYYGLAAGFVHAATHEQWGLVVNEAMASSLPVVVSNRCGAGRTVVTDGRDGVLVDPATDGIASGLVALCTMPAERRAAMGEAAARTIAEWGPRRFATGLEAALSSAAAARRRRTIAPWDAAIVRHLQTRLVSRVA